MLVIRRRAGESLLIGEDVEVEILEITAGQVKLGIRAPRQIQVLRREVQLTRLENQTASIAVPDQAALKSLIEIVQKAIPDHR
jgi:carbon storage regulator